MKVEQSRRQGVIDGADACEDGIDQPDLRKSGHQHEQHPT